MPPPDWVVPPGYVADDRSSRCRSCRAEILWATTPKGKKAPLDPDGQSHFVTCPDAAGWRK